MRNVELSLEETSLIVWRCKPVLQVTERVDSSDFAGGLLHELVRWRLCLQISQTHAMVGREGTLSARIGIDIRTPCELLVVTIVREEVGDAEERLKRRRHC